MAEKVQALDGRFHEARLYMTPGVYQGKEILVYIGACKESGCNNNARHTDRQGRDRLVWNHRRNHILAHRQITLEAVMDFDSELAWAMIELADKHTHSFEEWLTSTEEVYRAMVAGEESMPNTPYQNKVAYDLGLSARVTALRASERTD